MKLYILSLLLLNDQAKHIRLLAVVKVCSHLVKTHRGGGKSTTIIIIAIMSGEKYKFIMSIF